MTAKTMADVQREALDEAREAISTVRTGAKPRSRTSHQKAQGMRDDLYNHLREHGGWVSHQELHEWCRAKARSVRRLRHAVHTLIYSGQVAVKRLRIRDTEYNRYGFVQSDGRMKFYRFVPPEKVRGLRALDEYLWRHAARKLDAFLDGEANDFVADDGEG